MLQTIKVQKVSTIPHPKNGRNPIVVIHLNNGKKEKKHRAIVRTYSQFLTDLKDSFLIASDIESMDDVAVLRVLKQLKNGTVTGEISYHDKGDKYTIDANHSAITNQNHELYGKVTVGQVMEVQDFGTRITEGFLDFELSTKSDVINANAEAYADKRLKFEGFMKAPAVVSTDTPETVENFDIEEVLDAEVMAKGEVVED